MATFSRKVPLLFESDSQLMNVNKTSYYMNKCCFFFFLSFAMVATSFFVSNKTTKYTTFSRYTFTVAITSDFPSVPDLVGFRFQVKFHFFTVFVLISRHSSFAKASSPLLRQSLVTRSCISLLRAEVKSTLFPLDILYLLNMRLLEHYNAWTD